jgi:hypothetical protein
MKEDTAFIRCQSIINKHSNLILTYDYKLSVGVCKVYVFNNDMGDSVKLIPSDLAQYNHLSKVIV